MLHTVNVLIICYVNKNVNKNQHTMNNNTVKIAKYKLTQHRIKGTESNLNIFEVARLMDAIKFPETFTENKHQQLFNSISLN